MEKKYIQTEETRYFNNEYDNMPSLDFIRNREYLDETTQSKVDWELVESICNKYGFKLAVIKPTFCKNSTWEAVIYTDTAINADYYQTLSESGNWAEMAHISKGFNDTYLKLHNCIHELDECTNLYFDAAWCGNVGLFQSHDTKAKHYCGADHLYRWNTILDLLPPTICDTKQKLNKGVYILTRTHHLKTIKS